MRLVIVACLSLLPLSAGAAEPSAEKGSVHVRPGDQTDVPPLYRLDAHDFAYELTPEYTMPSIGVRVAHLRFPSPVRSPHPENNTVHALYYRPDGPGPFPGVIVLDITAGDQTVSRAIATHLAQHQIAALFVQMAYYGPRRPPGTRLRLLSTDVLHTTAAVRQTILDVRAAAAWMASRPELDARRLGILGTSLGSFIGTLAAEMEPRLGRVAILLGGGGLVEGFYDHPQAAPYRQVYEALGGTKEKLARLLAPYDPLTCAGNLKTHCLLMIAGKRDEVVPPKMAEALWRAAGKQKIVWYDCTHYTSVLYIVSAMAEVVKHFGAP
jgi:dienelactone hydrolase